MNMNKKRGVFQNKKGQLTVFIIIGIVIVGFAVLVYVFYPNIKSNFGFEEQNPSKQRPWNSVCASARYRHDFCSRYRKQ